MKWFVVAALCLATISTEAIAQKKPKLKTQMDSVSYAIGLNLGANIRKDSLGINPDVLLVGLKDAIADKGQMLTHEQIGEVMSRFEQMLTARQQAKTAPVAAKNKQVGEAFLAQNKNRQGVVVLPSGLQYEVITPGAGKKPTPSDNVTVHYTGTLIDGKVFDSSVQRGEPAKFGVSQVIRGWTEALQLMQEGAKWKLYIPSELAYGPNGAGGDIGPNSVLVFEVELLKVN